MQRRPQSDPLDWSTDQHLIPYGAGIYVIWASRPGGFRCLYVGMSTFLRLRLGTHFSRSCDSRIPHREMTDGGWRVWVTFAYYGDDPIVSSELDRHRWPSWRSRAVSPMLRAYEDAAILEFEPELNRMVPRAPYARA